MSRRNGPAKLVDFAWWTGLTLTDTRSAIESIKGELEEEHGFLFVGKQRKKAIPQVILLPPFDEYILGYTDRSLPISVANAKQYVTKNGMFAAVVLVDGVAQGTWKSVKGESVIKWFDSQPKDLPPKEEWLRPPL